MRALSLSAFFGITLALSCASSEDVADGTDGGNTDGSAPDGAAGNSTGGIATSGGAGGGTSSGGATGGAPDGSVEGGLDGSIDGSSGGGAGGGGAGGGTGSSKTCAAGYVVGIDSGGNVVCDTVGTTARDAVHQSCSIYLGWRDSCNGCTNDPAKWGYASGSSACANGTGADDSCTTPSLGGNTVSLIGINTDGGVGDDDKFYTGLHCAAVTPATSTGLTSCPTGQFATGVSGNTVSCATLSDYVTSYFSNNCQVYFGWRDSCNPCTNPPSKWGSTNDAACSMTGTNDTCTQPTLGTQSVRLLGVNTDGTVDDTDSFYMGLHCTGAAGATAANQTSCPAGQFVTAVNTDGTVDCASPRIDIESYTRASCYAYLGWQDVCNNCSTPPTKWGRANDTTCDKDAASNSVCVTTSLGGQTVNLFALNTDGGVDDNDTFYAGLSCF
jgi:hypothetical protein